MPTYGMPHKIDTFTLTEGDDGYGGIGITPVSLETKVPCRITVMTDQDKLEHFGNTSGEYWRVFAQFKASFERSQFIKVSATSIITPLDSTMYYRIVWKRMQIHRHGSINHGSLIVELEGVDLSNQEE